MSSIGSVYFFSLISSLCFLFGLNYLLRKSRLVASKILAVQFLVLGYLFVASYAILRENILSFPHFFRTVAPVFYALPPLNFLFIWYIFHPNSRFNKVFLLFFIPLVLQVIENTPFYLSSREVKLAEIQWMLNQGHYFAFSPQFMWFNPIWHVQAKLFLYVISFLAMVYYCVRFRLDTRYTYLFQKPLFNTWICGVLLFRLFTVCYIFYAFILVDQGKVTFINTDYLLVAEFVFHIVLLAANPRFLDSSILAEYLQSQPIIQVNNEARIEREEERLLEIAEKVEQCFSEEQVFLNSQLSAELLGSLTGYPHRMIGQAIKLKYQISFRDYLNTYRISYMENMLKDTDLLAKSSVESIAEASGFGSRQSFYTAFKKAKGCTPKEYFTSKQG